MVAHGIILSLTVLLAAASAATACQSTGSPQLDDNFKTPDPGWGRPDNVGSFEPNGLALRACSGAAERPRRKGPSRSLQELFRSAAERPRKRLSA